MQNILYYIKKYGKDALIILLLIICVALLIYRTFYKTEEDKSDENKLAVTELDQQIEVEETPKKTKIYIDIKGAVKKPGVYEVEEGSIMNEAITLAGGFKTNAYQNGINLSKKIADETVIYVYTKEEIKKKEEQKSQVPIETCKTPDYSICECIEKNASVIEVDSSANKSDNEIKPAKTLVNINTATIEELTAISGIGESKAQAIISYRNENGNFKSITDIMNVTGIGESLFAKIKEFITV